MSESGRKDLGYPRSEVTARMLILDRFCGGFGAGGCPDTLDVTQFVFPIRVSKYITFNRSLLLLNPEEDSVDIYTDGGAASGCDHSLDVRQPFWLAFSADGVMTDAEVVAEEIEFNEAPPFEIFVQHTKLPQPTEAAWENIIYVHIVWDSASYVQLAEMFDGILKKVKHDYDVEV